MSPKFFSRAPLLPPDPIFGVAQAFKNDPRRDKVDLTVGYYRNRELITPIFEAVKAAESWLYSSREDYLYQSIDGNHLYAEEAQKLIFKTLNPCIFSSQTVGGTGALRVAGELLKELGKEKIYLPNPTWANHIAIFERGGLEIACYRHKHQVELDFLALHEDLKKADPGSAVLFHGCCHNPVGRNPTYEQWEELSKLCFERDLFPLFDIAYQGLGIGLDDDAHSIRFFMKQGHEMLVTQSFSKNFGLYGERVGALHAVTSDLQAKERVGSVIKMLIRGSYSNPPIYGSSLVYHILSEPELRRLWESELQKMRMRIHEVREEFVALLGKDYTYIREDEGLFSLLPLAKERVIRLAEEKGIYLTQGGRVNMTGLNAENMKGVAEAILEVS